MCTPTTVPEISVFVKGKILSMGFLALNECFFETTEDEALKRRKKRGAGVGGKRRRGSKEDGDVRSSWVPDSLTFVGSTPEYIKELKCTQIPH